MIIALFFITIFLAYSNGANDNFKGVATLYGSRTVNYKTALTIATTATIAGSICAIFLANGLVKSFSGKGLVPLEITVDPAFLSSVACAAATTVFLATRLGFPISTTHGLIGGLIGAGLMAIGLDVNFILLGKKFFIPLMVSPILAFILGAVIYFIFSKARKKLKLNSEVCLCIGESSKQKLAPAQFTELSEFTANHYTSLHLELSTASNCQKLYTGQFLSIPIQNLIDWAHGISAVMVSFARGLNDTPKIAGLLAISTLFSTNINLGILAIAMAIGGLVNARKVAETMSHKITSINRGQGLSANLVTSFLVLVASKFGVPVSTTHVSVGSIFGISLINGQAKLKVIRQILLSWAITLPCAAVLAALFYFILSRL